MNRLNFPSYLTADLWGTDTFEFQSRFKPKFSPAIKSLNSVEIVWTHMGWFLSLWYLFGPECDVPVPGIPGTGIFLFFWWYRNRYRNKLVPKKSLGTGIGQIWYR